MDVSYYWSFSVSKVYREMKGSEKEIYVSFGGSEPTQVFAPFRLLVELTRGEQEIRVIFLKDGTEVESQTFAPENEQGERLIFCTVEFRGTRRYILKRANGVTTNVHSEVIAAPKDDASSAPGAPARSPQAKGDRGFAADYLGAATNEPPPEQPSNVRPTDF
jgi:hypothetical protein